MLVAAPRLFVAMLRPSEQNCARSYMWTVHSLLQHLTACPWHAVDLPQASLRDALPHDGPWRPLAVHMGVVVVHNGCSYWSGSTSTFPLGPRMALAAHMRVLCVSCTAFVYNSTFMSELLTQRARNHGRNWTRLSAKPSATKSARRNEFARSLLSGANGSLVFGRTPRFTSSGHPPENHGEV